MRYLSRAWILPFLAALLPAGDLESLGRHLFFDKRLSADGTVSCAMCHRPDTAFAESSAVSTGVRGLKGKLNSPSLLNLANAKRFFWDGRAATLEEQARGPLLNEIEMGNTAEALERRLAATSDYPPRFHRSFGDRAVSLDRIARALAAYERTLLTTHSLYDEWRRGRRENWTPEHEFGRQLFSSKGACASCHSGPAFTNGELSLDINGKHWKVPSLREVTRTAPYLHDGSIPTLPALLDKHAPHLSDPEKRALLRFLDSLSGEYSR